MCKVIQRGSASTLEVKDVIRRLEGKKIIRDTANQFYEVDIYIDPGTILRTKDAKYLGCSLKLTL